MRDLVSDIKKTLKSNFRTIFIFEVVYRIIFITVMVKTFELIVEKILAGSGYSYLTPNNVGSLLTNPLTYPLILLLLLVAVLISAFEMSVLYSGFRAGASGNNLKMGSLLVRATKRFGKMFHLKTIPVILLNSVIFYGVQALNIYQLADMSRRVSDAAKFIVNNKGIEILLVCFMLAVITVMLLTIFGLCRQTFGTDRECNIWKYGRQFYKGRLVKTSIVIITETLVLSGIFFAAYFICMVVVACLVVLLSPHRYEMIMVDAIGRYIRMILIFFNSIAAPVVGIGSAVGIFYHYEPHMRARIAAESQYTQKPWKKKMLKIIGAAVLAGTIFNITDVVANGNRTIQNTFGDIAITAHRGSSYEAPENTIPAIKKAIDAFADYAEIDVRETKDGVMVVMHDASAARTTGVKRNISDMTYDEVKKLDAGARFSREYAGTSVPTLEEVLKECKGKINLNIEIKTSRKDSKEFIHNVIELVSDMHMEEQCVFQSGTYAILKEIKKENLEIHTGYIVAAGYGNYFEDDNVDFFSVNSAYLSKSIVDMAHSYGKGIYAWTVNSRIELTRMKNFGVDVIITDAPTLAREVVNGSDDTQSLVAYIRMLMK